MTRRLRKPSPRHISPRLRSFAVEITKLRSDTRNANDHDEASVAAIAASLREFGQQLPVLTTAGGVVKAGNGVLLAARDVLGWKYLAAVRTTLRGRKLQALAIAMNRTAELSRWNKPVLAELLDEIAKEPGGVLSAAGFGDDIAEILAGLEGRSFVPGRDRDSTNGPRTAADAQVTIGGYRFVIPRKKYVKWLEDLRQAVGFDEESVLAELKRRLGL